MSYSFTARLGSAAGYTTDPTFTTSVEPRPGLLFYAPDGSGATKRWLIVWVESTGSAGIVCGCEGPLPPPPPPPSHP